MDFANMDRKRSLVFALVFQGVWAFCFTIAAFVVADTENVGFNVVLTALLYVAHILGGLHVITKSKTVLALGFLVGVSIMMCFISLMTAIFWGEYSGGSKSADGAVCAFAVILLLLEVPFTVCLVLWRDEIISEVSGYDDLNSTPSMDGMGANNTGTSQPYSAYEGGSYNQGTSADL